MSARTLPAEGPARPWRSRAAAPLVGLAALLAPAAAPPPERAAGARALFESYCLSCHSGPAPRGGFALDRLLDAKSKDADRQQWEKVWKIVRHEFMPPARAERPSDAQRRAITRWVEREVFKVEEARPDPGRVTIRRLNRMEYHHTVRDLFGVELDLARELPPDDTAFGFDNIGDAQTVSPALLETYLTLAEKVVAGVIVEDGPRHPQVRVRPNQFRPKEAAPKSSRAEQAATVELRHDGRYQVELQFGVGGWQEYGGEYELTVSFGGKGIVPKKTISVGGNKTYTLPAEVVLGKGRHELLVVTVPVKADAFGKLAPLPLSPRVTVTGPIGTGIYEYPESHKRVFFKGPAPADATARRAYAREILSRVAGKAFRRPASDATLGRLTDMALTPSPYPLPRGGGEGRVRGTFEAGIAQAVTAILSSPRFYYRAELQPNPDDPAAVHLLDEYALASRLSYLLWLSLPDDELTGLAAKGRLRKELPRQLRRMLADPKAERFFEDFAGQWLRTRNILLAPVSGRVQQKVDPLRDVMKRETDLLFEFVARQGRDLAELLTADYTFLNERLAAFYGVPGVKGEEMRRVQLAPESHRAGVLTHASLLISTSNPNRTSPVKRGLFVLENLLGREVPPPPPAVGNLEDVKVEGRRPRSLREQLALHREEKSCAACHAHFDPIGLALEHFDNTGRWRDKERGGGPIDPRSELLSGETVAGAADLARVLASRKEVFYRCVTEKLLTYALGRGLEPADAPTVDRIVARLGEGGGRFSVLLAGIVGSPQFQMRRGDAGEARQLTRPPPEKRKPATFNPEVKEPPIRRPKRGDP
jgi:mono/diheme cytochrome c family protein